MVVVVLEPLPETQARPAPAPRVTASLIPAVNSRPSDPTGLRLQVVVNDLSRDNANKVVQEITDSKGECVRVCVSLCAIAVAVCPHRWRA